MNEIIISVIAVTLLILLLIAGIVLTFFIAGRNRIKQQMELAETRLAFERELRAAETEISESVMTRVAQELHDNIGQMLTALHIEVENLKIDHPQFSVNFKSSENYISVIREQLRLLSRTLNNDYLGNVSLGEAIRLETERLNSLKRMVVEFHSSGGPTGMEKSQELMLFRIFQEIAQNALKHSSAKNLYVKADATQRFFCLTVRDDGAGFDKDAILSSGRANGLRNIMKRASMAGLKLQLETALGKGSTFVIEKVRTPD
jgi:signal transduction histidine kinase